jgi:hypothetical protein
MISFEPATGQNLDRLVQHIGGPVRKVLPWWQFWRGRKDVLTGLRMESDREFRKRLAHTLGVENGRSS